MSLPVSRRSSVGAINGMHGLYWKTHVLQVTCLVIARFMVYASCDCNSKNALNEQA